MAWGRAQGSTRSRYGGARYQENRLGVCCVPLLWPVVGQWRAELLMRSLTPLLDGTQVLRSCFTQLPTTQLQRAILLDAPGRLVS